MPKSKAQRPSWLFDAKYPTGTDEPPANVVAVVDKVIEELTVLAQAHVGESEVLDMAPDLYSGPCTEEEAVALTIEACATWLYGQLWGGPDRQALLDSMAN